MQEYAENRSITSVVPVDHPLTTDEPELLQRTPSCKSKLHLQLSDTTARRMWCISPHAGHSPPLKRLPHCLKRVQRGQSCQQDGHSEALRQVQCTCGTTQAQVHRLQLGRVMQEAVGA